MENYVVFQNFEKQNVYIISRVRSKSELNKSFRDLIDKFTEDSWNIVSGVEFIKKSGNYIIKESDKDGVAMYSFYTYEVDEGYIYNTDKLVLVGHLKRVSYNPTGEVDYEKVLKNVLELPEKIEKSVKVDSDTESDSDTETEPMPPSPPKLTRQKAIKK